MTTFKVVSDLICPWCYIGKRRLEAALQELPAETDVSVSWHPFQLNPDMSSQGMDRKEYCIRKFGSWDRCQVLFSQLTEAGRTVGIHFRFELQSTIPRTFDAHRAIWLAGQLGVQDAVVEALFRAYFCEGANLSSRAELIEVAAAAGLDPSRLEEMLNSDEGAAEVQSEEREVKSLGISSVPLFIIQDRVAVSGAQPSTTLLRAFQEAQRLTKKRRKTPRKTVTANRRPEDCKV